MLILQRYSTLFLGTKDKAFLEKNYLTISEREVLSLESTNIAHVLDNAEEMSQYDAAEIKNVLSNKYILAWIMSRTAPEFSGMSIPDIIQCYGNYSKPARYDLLRVIMICLGSSKNMAHQDNGDQKLLRLLSVIADDQMTAVDKLHILDKEYDITTANDLKGRVNDMCNWSEGIVERVSNRKDVSSVENVMRGCNVSLERACEILQIKPEAYHLAKSSII